MDFAFSPEDEAFRVEVRAFLKENLPSNWYGGSYGSSEEASALIKNLKQKAAAKGWLTMAWPKEYGGSDAPISRQLVFAEETTYYRAGLRDIGVGFLGPAIMRHGTEEQKKRFLGPMSRAEITFHQGFSEPDAGSDLAGIKTKAIRDGDDFVISGQKIWGGELDKAQYSFLLARSDPDAPKHKGISFLIIPADTPGITFEKFGNLGGGSQMIVYYDNCRVSAQECLIGEENQGWYIATTVLNHERGYVEHAATSMRLLDELVELWHAQGREKRNDTRTSILRNKLAQIAIEIEVCRMMAYRIGWMQDAGMNPSSEASVIKIFGSELTQRFAHVAGDVLGLYAQIDGGTANKDYVSLAGRVEHNIRGQIMWTIAGGTSEIQRNVIATRGLGLPRG